MTTDNLKNLLEATTSEKAILWKRVSKLTRSDGHYERVFSFKDGTRTITVKGETADDFEVLHDTHPDPLPEPRLMFSHDDLEGARNVLNLWLDNNHDEAAISDFNRYRHALPGIFEVSIGLNLYEYHWDEALYTNTEEDSERPPVPLSMTMQELKHSISISVTRDGGFIVDGCQEELLLHALPDFFERESEGTLCVKTSHNMTVFDLVNVLSKAGVSIVQGKFEGTERLDFTVGQLIKRISNHYAPLTSDSDVFGFN